MVRNFPEPEIFTLDCPTQQILDVIADKWSVIVIYCLAYGAKRYSQIQRRIEGISQKVLTQTLRNLERHGLVERKNVEYSLTSLGVTLLEPLQEIAAWSRVHFSEVTALRVGVARRRHRYDQKNLR
ncbi:helix-turn-helix transcriptional regulator [Calothrix membranacea FACHB-236]|nr:helix-turn-helix transcriptional regulator [Calothrix membranacea FACHB-236]